MYYPVNCYDSELKQWYGKTQPSILNPEANFGQIVWNLLSRAPDKVIQINADIDNHMTCHAMKKLIAKVAMNFLAMGCKLGDIVTLVCANSNYVAPIFIGSLSIGMVVNPLPPGCSRDDLVYMMRQTQSKFVFCDKENRAVVEEAAAEAIDRMPKIYFISEFEGDSSEPSTWQLGKSISFVSAFFSRKIKGEELFVPLYLGNSNTLRAVILFTSGSNDLPKGVCLSHAHLIEIDLMAGQFNVAPIFNFSGLFSLTGMYTLLASLYYQRPRVITRRPFHEETIIDIIEKYKVADIFTPPSYITGLMSHYRMADGNLRSIRRWTLGDAYVSKDLQERLEQRLRNVGLVMPAYGITEIGTIAVADNWSHPYSVGKLASNLEAKIVNQYGQRLGETEIGEIRLKFKHRFLGYINNEQATRAAYDEEDFFKTGDYGYFDKHGSLFVCDRVKDIIRYNDYEILPSELEAAIEKVDGVKRACVIGVPQQHTTSELITAVIVRREESTRTQAQLLNAIYNHVRYLRRIRGRVYFVDRLPTTVTGKVLRRAVKEMVLQFIE